MKKIEKFNKELCKIKYGWYDKEGRLHESLKEGNFGKNYRMQYIDEVKRHKSAICWDLCEVEREFFKKTDYQFITVFAVLKKFKRKPCHTFLIFKEKDKYCWFEASWSKMKGIRKYDSLEELFDDVRNNFGEFTKCKDYNKEEIEFYKYGKPRDRIGCNGFYIHCMYFGKRIKSCKKLFK
mgnify:CR=1 FL=1